MKHSDTCPPFPTGSVDFNAIHEAALKGKLDEHVAALSKPAEPAPADEAASDQPAVKAK